VAAAFQAWLLSLPARWHRRLATATPEDVVVYSETVWLQQHAGSLLPDGSAVALPFGHNTMLSMLSTTLNLLDRHGPWRPSTGEGNSISSELVSAYFGPAEARPGGVSCAAAAGRSPCSAGCPGRGDGRRSSRLAGAASVDQYDGGVQLHVGWHGKEVGNLEVAAY